MSDRYDNNDYNKTPDDIDDFFAEFDKKAAMQNRPSSVRGDKNYSSGSRRSDSHGNAQKDTKGKLASKKTSRKGKKTGAAAGSNGRGGRTSSRSSNVLNTVLFAALAVIMGVGLYVGVVFATSP